MSIQHCEHQFLVKCEENLQSDVGKMLTPVGFEQDSFTSDIIPKLISFINQHY